MCTVTFFKNEKGEAILTSNRDEKIHRPTIAPQIYTNENVKSIYPKDEVAEGTWISVDENQALYCLLNGGFQKHISTGNYKKSRGLIILDLIKIGNFDSFYQNYEFKGLEPFTLIVFQKEKLYELKWDSENTYLKKLSLDDHYIWSSATLYSKEESTLKSKWFNRLFEVKPPTVQAVLNIHNSSENEKGFLLEKDDLTKTVSISQMVISNKKSSFYYLDLLNNKEKNITF